MSKHYASVKWQLGNSESFTDSNYSRAHSWEFDGGLKVPASSSPQVVPLPYSLEENIDPEEAFVASLASCHMLFFLAIAAKKQLKILSYTDHAYGVMTTTSSGKTMISEVVLQPEAVFSGDTLADRHVIEDIHHQSHCRCFIANSVISKVSVKAKY